MATSVTVRLDVDQVAAVEIRPEARQVVLAGPGSGKTEVVAALIEHLVYDEGLDPAAELLILSFSNAAVHAVSSRFQAQGREPVAVQTIDSLCAEVVRELSDEDARTLSYDQRVARATGLLQAQRWDRLDQLVHVVVDEVQDVVGVRADFLYELLRGLPDDSGFTVLGDPAQGIYDFQLDKWSSTTSTQLLQKVLDLDGTRSIELKGQYRAKTRDTRSAVDLRCAVVASDPGGMVDSFEAALVAAGPVSTLIPELHRWSGTTAFLTSDNGEALVLADELWDAGLPVRLRRAAHDRLLSPWIASTLGVVPQLSVDRDRFAELLIADGHEVDPSVLWRAARMLVKRRGPALDIPEFVAALQAGNPVPPELLAAQDFPFVVSTIHRAKGLEFDSVVLVEFDHQRQALDEFDDYLRRRYVAVTRARSRLVRAQGPSVRGVLKDRKTGRWVRCGWQSWQTLGFQARGGDIDVSIPPEGGRETQEYLRVEVQPGDPVELHLDPRDSSLDIPRYKVMHTGRTIARTSMGFGEDLAKRVSSARTRGRGKLPWPRLTRGRIDSVMSVAAEPRAVGEVGRHGLWLAPSVIGLLDVLWRGETNG